MARTQARGRWVFVVVAVAVLAIVAGTRWRARRAVSVPSRPTRIAPAGPAPARAAVVASPARVVVTVRDARGPIADASVRLAPEDGEVVTLRTGSDGVARADALAPGRWKISASAADHAPAALPATMLAAGGEAALAIELMSGGRTLRGRVADTSGGPIAGVRIDAARLTLAGTPDGAVATTSTGADGTYRVSVAEGVLTVVATSADYAPQARTVEVGAAGAVADFALVPGGVIEGVVRDERTREPVDGARVEAAHDRPSTMMLEGSRRETRSGADGRFRLAGLRPGSWQLSARVGARGSRAAVGIGLGVAEQIGDVELWVGASPVIRGAVVDETGAGVAGADVLAYGPGGSAKATADAAGSFVLEHLPPGTYQITAKSPSHLAAGPAKVELVSADVEHVVVSMRLATVLRGHVEPRQACEVQQAPDTHGEFRQLPAVSSGADGEFVVGPDPDGAARLTARCASGDQGTLTVTVARGMADVVLRVTPGAAIAGHVVDADGKPVVGVGVVASVVGAGEQTVVANGVITSGAQVRTDAAGVYAIEGLSPGSYQLGVLDRGMPVILRQAVPPVALAGNERKTGVDLAIDRADGTIAGTVTGPDGAPVADAWVSVEADVVAMMQAMSTNPSSQIVFSGGGDGESVIPPTLTDARGHYEVHGLARGLYNVTGEAQRGELRASVERARRNTTVDLKLLGVAVLSGTVTSPDGPVPLFSLTLEGPSYVSRSFTDGRFSLGRIDPGAYTLRVEAANGSAETKLQIQPGVPAQVALTLATKATLTGTLVDAAGKPLVGALVVVMPDRGEKDASVMINEPPPTTGPDGSFRVVHPAGLTVLAVILPGGMSKPFFKRGLALEPGKVLDLGVVTVTLPAAPPPAQPQERAPVRPVTAAR